MFNERENKFSGRWFLVIMAGCGFFVFCAAIAMLMYFRRDEISGEALMGMVASAFVVIQGVYKDYVHTKALREQQNGNGKPSNAN